MVSDGVWTSLIGLVGGVLVAYITVRFKRNKPKSEYIDTAFEAYEAMMKRVEAENVRLRGEVSRLSEENYRLKNRRR